MNHIFKLIIIDKDLSYENHSEEFNIGFFSCYEKAFQTAKIYLKDVRGFKDYPCEYRIIKKNILNGKDVPDNKEIHIIQGWNLNNRFDEVEIIESECFTEYDLALKILENMRLNYTRTEWCINKYKINECYWKDGFLRL